jgi:leader peptidase (prepilin peptidase)/N-methyltransferase
VSAAAVASGVAACGVIAWSVGVSWSLLLLLPLVPPCTALAVVDLRTHRLPVALVRPTLVLAAVLTVATALLERDGGALLRAVVAALAVSGVFHLLWWVHPAGLGYGDVRFAPVLGLALGYLGWPELLVGLYAAFLLFGLPGVLLAVVRRDRALLRTAYPFGPFLVLGGLVGVAAGGPW